LHNGTSHPDTKEPIKKGWANFYKLAWDLLELPASLVPYKHIITKLGQAWNIDMELLLPLVKVKAVWCTMHNASTVTHTGGFQSTSHAWAKLVLSTCPLQNLATNLLGHAFHPLNCCPTMSFSLHASLPLSL
jgi:hypothetical protein